MTRLGAWIVGIVAGLVVGVTVLALLPRTQAPKPSPVAALVLRVDALEATVNALEIAAAAKQREDTLLLAEVVRLQAEVVRANQRLQAIERVVPVQAIRDRAAQR